ncbi:trehalose-6-phosphate synthase [Magnetospirillum gryphiswaldense MSR-1 v2]|uniref:Trehalose-6-phosphate synthase n=1 Tax=Magnetospirillum gryphiswaldense (strain DSM 6361 / JCM 21280 / NBRC 15271 / MSR-1) TaxID=431944 RepID=V6F2Q5_MAGGM|nr:trehalose-6-phosphate synthase [Magnetospirillum gryphiswaldense]CDK99785.1 trehalose-6-phosphate synthase [Magnetospirillum gryphiswaldense MSR-1 v2]
MRMAFRFILPLLLVLGGIAWAAAPLVGTLIERWFRADVEMRSQLVFHSIEDTVTSLVMAQTDRKAGRRVDELFKRIAQDERLLALGLCTPDNRLNNRSAAWPKDLGCPMAPVSGTAFLVERLAEGAVLAASFALSVDGVNLGRLVILHDLSFIERRSSSAEYYLAGFLALLGLAAATVTAIVARLTLRSWLRAARKGLSAQGGGEGEDSGMAIEVAPLVREMRKMLRDLDVPRALTEAIRVDWGPESLRNLLRNELPDAEVLVVSNREPYIHNLEDGQVALQRPASGLVTALEPIMRACGGTWIAHGSGSADRMTVDGDDRLAVPPEAPAYTLRRLWLSDEEQEGYYYGLANEGLWPLCHIAFVRPTFRASDWEQYVAVNQKFANALVAEARTRNPVVLVQDYHFALLPRMVREKLPEATIITFWHIPWPNAEVFSICPWKEEILSGLLGSSILGFHTQFHCLNFLETVDRFLECQIDREHSTVRAGDNTTLVRPYPISIEWPPAALAAQAPVDECRKSVRLKYGLAADALLAVGVERFDYTKGIADRFRAVESLLEVHPECIGRLTMLQVAAPTRSQLAVYRDTQTEAEAVAEAVNARFGTDDWAPIILVPKHHEPEAVFTLFRAADLCLVSSLHDGMNLVAKEFVAARDDEDGVLVLSTFAGASRELLEALIVNPYDIRAMGDAIHAGLSMPLDQRRERMRLMREMVGENNIYFWAGRMLLDAARMRKRQHIERQIAVVSGKSATSIGAKRHG